MPHQPDTGYLDALLRFQEFCESHGLSFAQEMVRVLNKRVGYIPPPPANDRLPTAKQIQARAAAAKRWGKS